MTVYLFDRLVFVVIFTCAGVAERFDNEPSRFVLGLATIVAIWALWGAQAEARRIWPKGGPRA